MKKRYSVERKLYTVVMMVALSLPMAAQVKKLSGTPMGSPSVDYSTGNISTTVNQPADAFDGDLNTFYASYGRARTWVGLDLGTPHVITRVGWCPRNHSVGPDRVRLALFEGANREDFMDAVPLYLVPASGTVGTMEYAPVNVSRGFRYVRYVGPNDARCNIGELAFYGKEGAGDDSQFYQVTNLPTVSIRTLSGSDPQDKVNDLEASLTITYDQGRRIQESPITTRLRGNASMGFPKKPYRIKFNDGKSHRMLEGSPLESPAKAKKWTLINNYGDKTLMRNIVAFEVSRRLGMPYTVYCQAVDVIMNGEYKGCYQLCDQITVDPNRVPITEMDSYEVDEPEVSGGYLIEVDAYASSETSWFNSSRGNPVTIKSPDEEDIVSAQTSYIRNYFNKMENALFSSNYKDPEKGYRSFFDVESFARHFLVGEFSGNTDTYWSTYMYKERGEQTFTVGPCWDFDLAFNNDNRIYPVNDRTDWIFRSGGSAAGNMRDFVSRILTDEYAVGRLERIWKDARDHEVISEESLVAFVDSMADHLRASATLNFLRWPILSSRVHQNAFALGSYQAEVNVVRTYLPERIAWFDEKLNYEHSDLYPDSTFYIDTPQELIEFTQYVRRGGNGSNAYLTADIDMESLSNSFLPIGNGQNPFCGTFDGQGHRISNLDIEGGNDTGLFGIVTGGATLRNFVLDSTCSISGESYVGIVGSSNGPGQVTLQQIGNEATVSAAGINAGALIGCNYNSASTFVFENCYNTGTIVGSAESGALSGWVGSGAVFTNCYNIGTVSGYDGDDTYLFRGWGSLVNSYSTLGGQGILVDTEAVGSGELCYRLNGGNTDEPVWRQTLQMDPYPTFLPHAIVDHDGTRYFNLGINYSLGDMNGDGNIDALDLEALASYLIGKPQDIFVMDNADVHADNRIDLCDLVATANLIKSRNAVKGKRTPRREQENGQETTLTLDDFALQASAHKQVGATAVLAEGATAFYLELTPGPDLSLDDASVALGALKGSSHTIDAHLEDDVLRIVAYSPSNEDFNALSGELFTLGVTASEDFAGSTIALANVQLATAAEKLLEPGASTCNVALEATPVSTIIVEQELYILNIGEQVTLSATVLPATASKKDLAWACSDTHVGYVSNGVFTARNSGGATLTATALDGSGVVGMARVRVLGSEFEIASAADLQDFSTVVNAGHTTMNGLLATDIDMEGMAFQPIGTEKNLFAGTFDGQFHTIRNLVIEKPNDTAVGLFGQITSPATIKNLVLDASCLIVGHEKAGIVGRSDRSGNIYLQNLGNEGSVKADIAPAGIIGNANNSSVALITNCYSTGPITTILDGQTNADAAQISGWLGNVGAKLTNCWSTSPITGFQTSGYASTTDRTFARMGGAKNTFLNCYSQVSKQVNLTDIARFRSGEVTWLLNGGETESPVWFQTLPDDEHPTFLGGHSVVYKVDDNLYTNTPDGIQRVTTDDGQQTTVYDLQGRPVTLSKTKHLRKGIYIVGGQKRLVK